MVDNTYNKLKLNESYLENIFQHLKQKELFESNNIFIFEDFFSLEYSKSFFSKRILDEKKAFEQFEYKTVDQFLSEFSVSQTYLNLQYFEEIILLSNIVSENNHIDINPYNIISVSQEIYKILKKIEKHNIDISDLYSWLDEDLAQHWWDISMFLHDVYNRLNLARNNYKFNINTNNNSNKFIFIGLSDNLDSILDKIQNLNIESYFVSPIINESLKEGLKIKEIYSKINYDKLLIYNDKIDKKNIIVNNLYDIFEEELFVFDELLKLNNKNVHIICEDKKFYEILVSDLNRLNIDYNSSFKEPYLNFDESELFINLANFKSSEGSIKSFEMLLRSSIFINNQDIENLIRSLDESNIFYDSYKDILINYNDEKISELVKLLDSFLKINSQLLNDEIKLNYEIFKDIYNLFNLESNVVNAEKFEAFIEKIIYFPLRMNNLNSSEYTKYISDIFTLKYTKPFSKNARITITDYNNSKLVVSDKIIFCNLNNESILESDVDDIWLSNKIFKKMGLISEKDKYNKILNIIESKFNNQNITLTRSKFKDAEYLKEFSFSNSSNIYNYVDSKFSESKQFNNNIEHKFKINTYNFPDKLYVSNIEMLSRNPYGFIFRKILNLKPMNYFSQLPDNKDFGSLVHDIIEEISNTGSDEFESIIESKFSILNYSSDYKITTKDRLINIAQEFYRIHTESINNNFEIYSEIEGEMKIQFSNKRQISISAIADRIEVSKDLVRIIDFKTGSPPTFKDVNSGKSPQLMIEAMLLISNGFNGILYNHQQIEIVYYKVNSKKPYFEEKTLSVSKDDILYHKDKMIEFLEYYYLKDEVDISNINLPEYWKSPYDDYKFIRREL